MAREPLTFGSLTWLLSLPSAAPAILTNGNVLVVTEIEIGSNKTTIFTITADVPDRCFVKCLQTAACGGFNMERIDNDHVTCDLKEGDHYAKDMIPMPGVKYVGSDSLAYHNGMMFTANGTVNDHDTASYNCAETYLGPWWYNSCSEARLTGEYGMVVDDVEETTGNGRSTVYYHGIMWTTHLGVDEHPQFVEMKMCPI